MNERIARFTQALAKSPGNELARFSLGKAHFDAGEFKSAREHFVLAVTGKPDWMAAQILLGKCALSLGDSAAAIEILTRALALAKAQSHEGPQSELEQMLAELA